MANAPPARSQRRIIPDPHHSPADHWEYAISKAWLDHWKTVVSPFPYGSQASISSSSSSMTSSGGSSVDSDLARSIDPVNVSEVDIKNYYIGKSVWDVLVTWFGMTDEAVLRRRHALMMYMPLQVDVSGSSHILCDKCLDVLMVHVCLLQEVEDPDKCQILQLYAWDNIAFLESQLRHKLCIPQAFSLRLWLMVQKDEEEKCELLNSPSALTYVQALTQMYPELTTFMTERQNRPPAAEHPTAFSSMHPSQSLSQRSSEPTRTYLFQELMLRGYKLTIAVENVLVQQPDDLLGQSMSPILNRHEVAKTTEWDQQLRSVLDVASTGMKGSIDRQNQQILKLCQTIVGKKVNAVAMLERDLKEKLKTVDARAVSLASQEADINERESILNDKLQKFKVGLADFLVQKKRLEGELKSIEYLNRIADSKITLNVGGNVFQTSVETLKRDPESILGLMFSGRHPVKKEPDGSYFIDRDGTNFRYILNYLRDGSNSFAGMPPDVKVLRELRKEADYYQLKEFSGFLQQKVGGP